MGTGSILTKHDLQSLLHSGLVTLLFAHSKSEAAIHASIHSNAAVAYFVFGRVDRAHTKTRKQRKRRKSRKRENENHENAKTSNFFHEMNHIMGKSLSSNLSAT